MLEIDFRDTKQENIPLSLISAFVFTEQSSAQLSHGIYFHSLCAALSLKKIRGSSTIISCAAGEDTALELYADRPTCLGGGTKSGFFQ
jgi:hypothetical protein